jgi:hypothetical protein
MSNPPITPLTPTQVATEEAQAEHENFIERELVDADIAADELTGGPQDETISTRLAVDAVDGHGLSKKIGEVGSKCLDVFQKDHGADASAGDLARAETEATIIEKSGIA